MAVATDEDRLQLHDVTLDPARHCHDGRQATLTGRRDGLDPDPPAVALRANLLSADGMATRRPDDARRNTYTRPTAAPPCARAERRRVRPV
jgi:hypothetical protein